MNTTTLVIYDRAGNKYHTSPLDPKKVQSILDTFKHQNNGIMMRIPTTNFNGTYALNIHGDSIIAIEEQD